MMFLMRTVIHFTFVAGLINGLGTGKATDFCCDRLATIPVLILLEFLVEKRIGCWYANVWQLF